MRRKHWWGAAAGVGVLAITGVAVPAAYAANGTKPGVVTTTPAKVIKKKIGAKHHHGHRGCEYPPHGHPDVWIDGPDSVHHGSFSIKGVLRVNGCGYENYVAGLYKKIKHDGDKWQPVSTAKTGKKGEVSFTVTDGGGAFRIITAPAGGLTEGVSRVVKVNSPSHH